MTPEEAAGSAAGMLAEARMHAADPERAVAFVAIADGWTRLHTALKAGQSKPITVNMTGTTVKDPDLKKLGEEFAKRYYGYAHSEPEAAADLPDDVRALGDAVNQMREEWTGSTQERRKEMWHEVRRYSDATWRTCCNPPAI